MKKIDISKYDKAAVLVALYNASKQQGMGRLNLNGHDPFFFQEQASELLKRGTNFDYLNGRVMKVDLGGDTLDPYLYDRDNGEGAASRAISAIKPTASH